MPPGEEDDVELLKNVAVRDVEVMLEHGHIDVFRELWNIRSAKSWVEESIGYAYVLLHILLSCHHRALAYLESHLRCAIIHETSKCWMHIAVALRLTLSLRASAISVASRLLLLCL